MAWTDGSLAVMVDAAWRVSLVLLAAWGITRLARREPAALRHAIWAVIQEVVAVDLTPRQRQALDLVVINGVSTEDVEEYLGVTASALYKMTHDARRKLKAGLEKRGFTTQEILGAFSADA